MVEWQTTVQLPWQVGYLPHNLLTPFTIFRLGGELLIVAVPRRESIPASSRQTPVLMKP